jgi:hypothetical protein
MSTENTAPEVVEAPNTAPADTSSQVEQETPDTPVVETPEKFKPWEIKEEEESAPADNKRKPAIPYDRFREVNEEKKAYQAQLAEYEKELATYRSRQEQLAQIKTPADIKIEDYDDVEKYLADRDEAIKAATVADIESRFQQREIARLEQQQNEAIIDRFGKNVEEAVKYNPDIAQAVGFLDQHADKLHPAVARELLVDENAAEVIHDIVTNQELLTKLFRGTPDDAVRMINRLSAKIDVAARRQTASSAGGNDVPVPAALTTTAKVAPKGIPVTVKGGGKATTKDIAKMNKEEYRAFKQNGYK